MIGKATQTVFIRIYVMLIMSLYFWVFSLTGVIILGVGPALRTTSEMYDAHGWEYMNYHFHEAWQLYKQNFKTANIQFWGFGIVTALLSYSLYLGVQLKVGWMLFIVFILVFAILLCLALWLFTLVLQSHYDVSFKIALRLGISQFFSSFPRLLEFLVGLIAIVVVTVKWPGLILFLTIPALVLWTYYISDKWFAFVDRQLVD